MGMTEILGFLQIVFGNSAFLFILSIIIIAKLLKVKTERGNEL